MSVLQSTAPVEHIEVPAAKPSGFESPAAAAFASALFIFGPLSTLITPALLAGCAEQFQWSPARLGWIASADLIGMLFGSLTAFYWQRRSSWRRVTVMAIILLIAVNTVCALSDDFYMIASLRLLSGTAEGILIAVYTAYLANARSPERLLAITTFFQIVAQAVMMVAAGFLVRRFGMNGIYGLLSICVIVLLPMVRLLPRGWPDQAIDEDKGSARLVPLRKWLTGSLVLAALAAFEVFQGGTFAFLNQFGSRAGLTPADTLSVVGLSTVGSLLGPLAAFALGERLGVAGPLAASCALLAILMSELTIGAPVSSTVLVVELGLLQAAWLFAICYLYAGLIKVNNILTQAGTPISSLALAGGSSLTGVVLQQHGSVGLLWIALLCLGLTAGLAVPTIYLAGERPQRR
jgi:predicted MFS family arabinose efflux permease